MSRMPRISATRLQDLFFCFLNTTMPTDDENQPRYDTPHQPHTASTRTHTHRSHTAHDPPPHATLTNTKGHTTHTHTHTKTKEKGLKLLTYLQTLCKRIFFSN